MNKLHYTVVLVLLGAVLGVEPNTLMHENEIPTTETETTVIQEVTTPTPTPIPTPTPTPKIEKVSENSLRSLGKFKLTAYCPCKKCNGKWAGGITSTGVTAKAGRTIAVDPKKIPYGTEVTIDGYGVRIAEDCGGAIKGNRIDVFFDTHKEAMDFGVQYAEVFIN